MREGFMVCFYLVLFFLSCVMFSYTFNVLMLLSCGICYVMLRRAQLK